MLRALTRLRRDQRAIATIETAMLFPLLLVLLIGIMQAGWYMQSQNALRGVTGDISRSLAVEYQKANYLTNTQIQALAYQTAIDSPYMMQSDRLDVTVEDAETQPFSGVREIEITMSYDVPSILGVVDVDALTLNYTREIFVDDLAEAASDEESST